MTCDNPDPQQCRNRVGDAPCICKCHGKFANMLSSGIRFGTIGVGIAVPRNHAKTIAELLIHGDEDTLSAALDAQPELAIPLLLVMLGIISSDDDDTGAMETLKKDFSTEDLMRLNNDKLTHI